MKPSCIRSLFDFFSLFSFVFSLVASPCVLICLILLMDGFPSLIFTYKVFLLKKRNKLSNKISMARTIIGEIQKEGQKRAKR
jgi:hypothetical protein